MNLIKLVYVLLLFDRSQSFFNNIYTRRSYNKNVAKYGLVVTTRFSSLSNNEQQSMFNIDPSLQELPIVGILNDIKTSLETKNNVLLQAEPGAGKTTIVPLFLHSSFDNNILVVEPRRVATRSAAQRMASILNEAVGETVGYIMRGETKISSKTRVTVMTDGVLMNKLRDDPELRGVDMVIFDEFHERGVGSDTVLALCREVQMNFRPDDLKLLIMSATLLGDDDDHESDEEVDTDTEESTGKKLVRVLGGSQSCSVLQSEGRQYPIRFQYAKRSNPPHGLLLNDVKQLVQTMADNIEEGLKLAPAKGNILAFLPGAKEIRRVVKELKNRRIDADILPLYGALPKKDQDAAIRRPRNSSHRRVIVSSPIAEASLTIEGVTCVVDSGLRREPRFDAETGLPRLVTVKCSKDSAIQRAGRAGRTMEGICLRLFNEAEFSRFGMHVVPEICSTDLVPTTLFLSDWGYSSALDIVNEIPFVDPPPEIGIQKAYQMLLDLEAVETNELSDDSNRFRVTPHGRNLVKFPTHPRFASAIAKAMEGETKGLVAAVIAVALLEEEIGNRKFSGANLADEVKALLQSSQNTMEKDKILQFAGRISKEARDATLKAFSDTKIMSEVVNSVGTTLLPGFIDLVAQRKGDASYSSSSYLLSLGHSARLDGISDAGEYIVVIDTSSGDDGVTRIRKYVPITIDYLKQVSKEIYEIYTVESRGYEVRARRVVKVGSLVLSSTPNPSPPGDEVTKVLLKTISSLGVNRALIQNQSKQNLNAINNLRCRIRLAMKLSHSMNWPNCFSALDAIDNITATASDTEEILSIVEPWLAAAGSLKKTNTYDILISSLTPDHLMHLDEYFPLKIGAPDGSSVPISYSEEIPTASAKLQQFFGCQVSPCVGLSGNSQPISLTLLSPSSKTLAQTIDLPFFWKETYPSVRAEMRGRYPKHPWPEDPMDATPTRLTKKQIAGSKDQMAKEKVNKRKEKSAQRKKIKKK